MTKTIVIERYFFGFCYHRYTYTETVVSDKKECCKPQVPLKTESVHVTAANKAYETMLDNPQAVGTKHNLEVE